MSSNDARHVYVDDTSLIGRLLASRNDVMRDEISCSLVMTTTMTITTLQHLKQHQRQVSAVLSTSGDRVPVMCSTLA